MIVIYHCYGGAHSSVLAAALHTGLLSLDKKADIQDIINIPLYDTATSKEIGTPFYYGQDEFQNKIYIQGMANSDKIVLKLLESFLKIEDIPRSNVLLINTLKEINLIVRIGGFLSRKLGLITPGRPMTAYGLKKAYPGFIHLIKSVKEQISIA